MVVIATPPGVRAAAAAPQPSAIHELIRDFAALTALPVACQRVIEIADDRRAAARAMAETIARDPELAERLLRLLNSSFYDLSRPIDNVAQAVNVIGTAAVRNLTLAIGAVSAFRGIKSRLIPREAFWNTSVRCGLLARALARIARHQQIERLFAVGLMHAFGQLVMVHQAPENARRVLDQIILDRTAQPAIERQVFGFTSCELGAKLLEVWQLPPSVWLPIRHHRMPVGATDFRSDTALLAIAQAVTAAVAVDVRATVPPARSTPVIDPVAWLQCGLVTSVLPGAIAEVDAHWREVVEIMGTDS